MHFSRVLLTVMQYAELLEQIGPKLEQCTNSIVNFYKISRDNITSHRTGQGAEQGTTTSISLHQHLPHLYSLHSVAMLPGSMSASQVKHNLFLVL